MAAYNKVEVSLNTNAVEVGVPSPQTVNVTIPAVGPAGPTGPQGPKGDPGEVSGSIAWDNVTEKPATFTPSAHTHELADLDSSGIAAGKFLQADGDDGAQWADVADFNVPITAATASGFVNGNGVYYSTDVTLNSRNVFKLNKTYGMFFEASKWHIFENVPITANILYSSNTTSATYPWQVAWVDGDVDQSLLADAVSDVGDQFVFVGDNIPSSRVTDLATVATSGDYDDLSNKPSTFTPSAHASSHHTSGSDQLAAHQINGQTIFSAISATYSSDQTLTANRARQLTISNTNASGINVTLPTGTDGTLLGDTYVIIGGNQVAGTITIRALGNVSPPIYTTLVTINSTGEQYRFRAAGGTSGGWSLVPVDTHTHAASDILSGTLTHERGGLEADVSAYDGLVKISSGSTSAVTVTSAGEALLDDADAAAQRVTLGLGNSATLDTGTTAGTVAEGDHTHELNALDATGATDGHVLTADGAGGAAFEALPASGIPETLLDAKGDLIVASAADTAARLPVGGTNGHVLTVDSNQTLGVKWAAAASAMTGATNSTAGAAGLVPQPAAGEQDAFLDGRGQFTNALFNLRMHKLDNTRFYAPIGFSSNLAVNSVTGIAGLVPIFLPSGTIDRLSIYQNSPSVNGTGYVALYNSKESDGKPLSVVASGSFTITSGEAAAEKAVALSPTVAVKAGLYWVGYHNSGVTTSNRATGGAAQVLHLLLGTTSDINTQTVAYRITIATAGTWPDDPALNAYSGANHAAVFVRMT